ncbi:glycolipid transfer protein [Panus rudis PR-1116 ss-1]|nr:glycolipid transfer protein [Panus rudis PR-1116 ss-1]
MAPYWQTAKSFAEVPITEEGVDTPIFLQASDDFVNMFDLLGKGVFGFVQTDLRNNIAGVRERYNSAPSGSTTLENLVKTEAEEHNRHGTACLVRLIRGLLFTCKALQNMQRDPGTELHVCFKRSYDSVLKHHHSFLIRSVVSVAIRAVPHRQDFYHRVSEGSDSQAFDVELTGWLSGLENIVLRMKAFLEQGGYGNV